MRAILGILGVLQIGGGILVYLFTESDMHEILASVMFGLGGVAVGLSGVIALLENQLAILTRQGSRLVGVPAIAVEPSLPWKQAQQDQRGDARLAVVASPPGGVMFDYSEARRG